MQGISSLSFSIRFHRRAVEPARALASLLSLLLRR
jgi:hypothetical protein